MVAEHFTEVDGSNKIYVGRNGVLPGLNAWPMPLDAPYKPDFDFVIVAVQEVCKTVVEGKGYSASRRNAFHPLRIFVRVDCMIYSFKNHSHEAHPDVVYFFFLHKNDFTSFTTEH